ncbi:MAG: phospholipase D-like domain-containing protein [Nanoarchaeota archaeon]|nr:phospholipase D-like domain-containing protein [Nanoarchaeota archaeon]
MRKPFLFLFFILFIGLAALRYVDFDFSSLTGTAVAPLHSAVKDQGDLGVYFCPREDCESALVQFLNSAEQSIHCALFEVGLDAVKNVLDTKEKTMEVKIITDNDYLYKFNRSFVRADTYGLMHNKFCVIDGKKVSTGSMNPTNNDAHRNNNNLLLINSSVLAQNYEEEFQEMWAGNFKKGERVRNPSILLEDISLSNYFCPEDHCAERINAELREAKESIYVMAFSFTNEGIANVLLLKHLDGVPVHGIMEARQVTKYSKYEVLQYQGLDVVKDNNPGNMHHKVFIIDQETVVTGSFNPTEGGDIRNDENILIIKDKNIAKKFREEFEYVYSLKKP